MNFLLTSSGSVYPDELPFHIGLCFYRSVDALSLSGKIRIESANDDLRVVGVRYM